MPGRRKGGKVIVGLIQMRAAEAPDSNLAKAVAKIEAAAKKGAQIVCLQELFRSRYFPQVENAGKFKLAESIPGSTTDALGRVARSKRIVIVSSIFERRSAGVFHNTAVVIDADGGILGKYRKMHIPDDPGYYEKFYFTPGDLGFPCFQTRYAKIGVLVCWDQWFPEAARLVAMRGAEIIFYPTAIGWPGSPAPRPGRKKTAGRRSSAPTRWRTASISRRRIASGERGGSSFGAALSSPTLRGRSSPAPAAMTKRSCWLASI